MQTLGIIPARSGSSGVKRKNLRCLGGKPLLAHTVEAAINSRLDRVILSTDSPEFAAVARQWGAETPFLRPAELATDTARAIDVIHHCLTWLTQEEHWQPNAVCYLQPTSPFRTPDHINKALDLLTPIYDSVVSVKPVSEHPYFMFRPETRDCLLEYVDLPCKPERRQDLPPIYALNDCILLSTTRYLLRAAENRSLIVNLKNFRPLYLDGVACVDINTEMDFLWAEFLLERRQ